MIEEFISDFKQNSAAYKAWGDFVASEIFEAIEVEDGAKENFLKIPIQRREKKESSIRGKALLHGLTDPKNQIRDLYGLRFVVLLTSEVRLIEKAVESNSEWTYDKVRDFGIESVGSAESFDYQSVHYVVTCRRERAENGVKIESGVCCEVQIRTMLQHAYAELTHDNIYKPSQVVPYVAKRLVARSMALMETTDTIFCQTLDELRRENKPRNELYQLLTQIYLKSVGGEKDDFDDRLNLEIIDLIKEKFDLEKCLQAVANFWQNEHEFIERIQLQRNDSMLFRQPVVLLLYWVAKVNDRFLRKKWIFESMKEEAFSKTKCNTFAVR